jgi:hypothetical protein
MEENRGYRQKISKFAEYESIYDGKTTDRRTAMWKQICETAERDIVPVVDVSESRFISTSQFFYQLFFRHRLIHTQQI